MQAAPDADDVPLQDDQEANQFEEDYYSDFARRVYMIAEQQSWDRAKTMKYFNDRQAFEKYYTNWQNRQLGVEEKIPSCVKRLVLDSQSRAEQRIRDERAKQERDRQEEERVILESKMLQKQKRQMHGTRKFNKFMEDQITHQYRRIENLKRAMVEEQQKAPHEPQISARSRAMVGAKAEEEDPDLAKPVHKRLYNAAPKPKPAERVQAKKLSPPRPQTSEPAMFRPQLSARTTKIMDSKRKGNVVNSLMEDANRRKVEGKKFKPQKKADKPEQEQIGETGESTVLSPSPKKRSNASVSTDLLMKRFDKDLFDVLTQFEIDEDSAISEVTMLHIMVLMGFVDDSNNVDMEQVQSIWQHLQQDPQPKPERDPEKEDEEADNGERIVVAHLRVFMAAILGFQADKPAQSANPDAGLLGTFDESTGAYQVTAGEVSKVHRRYKSLSANRTDFVLKQRLERQQERLASQGDLHKVTGRPELNQRSQKIFEDMKAKNKIQVGQSYEDYLISRGQQYNERRQQEQAKKDMLDPENRECTFQPQTHSAGARKDEFSPSKVPNSGNKWEELYLQAERKRGKIDRPQDEIEFEKNVHEMKFAPEIHEVNLRGTKNPIVAKGSAPKVIGQVFRQRLEEKMDFLNAGQFGTLADAEKGDDPGIIGDLRIGNSFSEADPERAEDDMEDGDQMNGEQAECLDMEVVIGDTKFVITIFPDSDPHALATEFAVQHDLQPELVEQLSVQISDNIEANFAQ